MSGTGKKELPEKLAAAKETKFCIHCAHCIVTYLEKWWTYKCVHSRNIKGYNAINGAIEVIYSIDDMRLEYCGVKEANFWERRSNGTFAGQSSQASRPTATNAIGLLKKKLSQTSEDDL